MSRRQRYNLTREQREAYEKNRLQAAKEQNEKEIERKKRSRAALSTTDNEKNHNKTTNSSGNDKESSHSSKNFPQKKKKKSSTSLESRGEKQESESRAESPHEKKSSTFAFSSARRISEGTNYLGTTLASPASSDVSSRPFDWSFRHGEEEDSKNNSIATNDNKRVSNSPAAKFSQDSSQDSAPRLVQVTQPRSNSGVKQQATLRVIAERSWHKKRQVESSSEESDSDDEITSKKSQPMSPKIGAGNNKPNSASKALSSRSDESEDENISRKTRAAPKKSVANNDSDSSSDEEEDKPTKARLRPKPKTEENRLLQESPGGIDAYVRSSPEQERPKKKGKASGPPVRDSVSLPRNPHAIEERQKERDLELARTPISPQDKVKEDSLWDDDDDEPLITSRDQRRRSAPRNAVQNHQHHDHCSENQGAPEVVQQQHSPQARNGENDDNDAYVSEDDESDFDEDGKHNLHPDFGEGPTFGPFELVPLKLENSETGDNHEVPASLSRYLPGFQREGIKFLYNAISNKKGAILGK